MPSFFDMTNNKTILILSIVVAVAVAGGVLIMTWQYSDNSSNADIPEKSSYPVDDPVLADMTLSLSSGNILGVKVVKEIPAIVIDINPDSDGRLVIDNPMDSLKKAFPDLYFEEYTILIDAEEVAIDKIGFDTIAISIREDSQRIEIVPFAYL